MADQISSGTVSKQALYGALKGMGLSVATIKSVLPSWWDDSFANDPLGLTELKILLARRLSIDPATIFADDGKVEFLPVIRRYKGGRPDLVKALQSSTLIANALCRTALASVPPRAELASFEDPVQLRKSILQSRAKYVGLPELLEFCWSAGIPVLHICFPTGQKKFDALAISEGGRHAIALCRNERSPAWLAFHLAHEIGHIALGHLNAEGMIIDEKIEDDALTMAQEAEANAYAITLLGSTGIEPPILNFKKRLAQVKSFLELASTHQVLPGHLVLKAGSRDANFNCARTLLNEIEGAQDARELISRRALDELRQAGITEEADEFLTKFSYSRE
jgi:hypothetical protein